MNRHLHILTSAITLMGQEATAHHRSVLKALDDLGPAKTAEAALKELQDPANDEAVRRVIKACGGDRAEDLLTWAEGIRGLARENRGDGGKA